MFKKIIKICLLVVLLCSTIQLCVAEDSVLDRLKGIYEGGDNKEGIKDKADVPTGDLLTDIFPKIIRLSMIVFGVVMGLFLIIGGIYMVLGGMDESFMQEAKKMFYYSILGALVVSLSFTIVYSIVNINWSGG